MTLEKNYQGLLAFGKKGAVQLFWRSTEPSVSGIFSVESLDGRTFGKNFSFIAFYRADGTKTVLSAVPELRASTLKTKTVLSFLDEQKNTLFATVGKGGAWKIIAATNFFRAPTVITALKTSPKGVTTILAFAGQENQAIGLARSNDDLDHWKYQGQVLTARPGAFDASHLSPFFVEINKKGILLVYSARDAAGQLGIGAALFDKDKPTTLLWRSEHSLWHPPLGQISDIRVIGGINIGKYFSLYIQSAEHGIECFPVARYWETYHQIPASHPPLPPRPKGVRIPLERFPENPVLEPVAKNSWESFATFNPAALYLGNRVHLLYRAQGYDGLSVLGYAASSDGIHIDTRETEPAFVPAAATETTELKDNYPSTGTYTSAGGTGGCEDPRLVEINGIVYLIYVSFDGSHPPGIALTHISTTNFLAKRWVWSKPKLISEPGKIQKNWVLFPEKINGQYAILHGLSPEIKIEYVADLHTLGNGHTIESLVSHGGRGYVESERLLAWDNIVRGVGAPPLKTEHGWLIFYHGMDMRDPGKYKVGVMLLDLQDPTKILRRAHEPVLEPETTYENSGHKPGVIYVCGAVIKDRQLFVYYGAADRTTGVATTNLDTFLQDLLKNQPLTLNKVPLKKHA